MNLYFECNMGAAGDMLASALLDLFDNREEVTEELNRIGLPHTKLEYCRAEQCGISGTHLRVMINGEEEKPDTRHGHHRHGRHLQDIYRLIDSLQVSDKVKADVKSVYDIVAQAESKAHRTEVGEVHFHELGMLDAIADITVTAYLLEKLHPQRIITSPINVGNGTVTCAHGILPVPAPATANILLGVPYYKSNIQTELCTPTGAAVLKHFTDAFSAQPKLTDVQKIGIGCGTKPLEQANIVRVYAFEAEAYITELSCNIDDMTGEEAAFAAERMMAEGALDCFISPIIMKKGRPAYLFTVLCAPEDEERFAALIFKHTATIGIRKYSPSRYTLQREFVEESGVRIKKSEGCGTQKEKIEFEDIKRLALEKNISVFKARRLIEKSTD